MRSIFSVTTPAENTSLLTIEELRAAAGVDDNTQDAALAVLGKQLSGAIARDCGVAWDGANSPTLLSEVCRQTFFPVRRTDQIRVARRPVTEISAVVVGGEVLSSADFLNDLASGAIWLKCGDWLSAEIVVDFTAGFTVAPDGLKLAAGKLMTALWAENGRDPNLKREVVEGVGAQEYWVAPASDPLMSAEISDLLAPYRERWF